jgi:hypothetical protein
MKEKEWVALMIKHGPKPMPTEKKQAWARGGPSNHGPHDLFDTEPSYLAKERCLGDDSGIGVVEFGGHECMRGVPGRGGGRKSFL